MVPFVVTYPIVGSRIEPSLNQSISRFNKMVSVYKGEKSLARMYGRIRYLIRD